MRNRFVVAGVLPALILLSACSGSRSRLQKSATAGDEIVEVEGMAPYNAADVPGSKAASLAAAQRAAVEMVVGVYVDAKTLVDKAVAIQSNILTHTQGYVKKYQILSERQDGPWYKTRIRALVATGKLHEALDSMGLLKQPAVGNPRVTILLQEWIGEKPDVAMDATRTLTQGLLDKGFQVVDLPRAINRDEDPTDIARSLNRGVAELLIAGLARAQSLGYGKKEFGGMSSFRANVSFRVLEVGTGEVLATVSQTASGLEATPDIAGGKALEAAAKLAVNDLVSLPQELAKRSHVTITLMGLKSFDALSNLQKSLRAQAGVKDLYLRSYVQADGLAVLDVHTDSITPQELADACVKIGGPSWTVYQVMGRTVQITTSPAGR